MAQDIAPGWTLGAPLFDRWLALEAGATHEIKPATYGDWSAALGFALRLAVRQRMTDKRPVLWCWPQALGAETGLPYGPGLEALGLPMAALVLVMPQRQREALWAMEEALRSGAVALVIGGVAGIGLTPARRLALAAAATGTPALLMTAPARPTTAATASRWRIARAPGGPHPLDPEAPGAQRYALTLERCRGHGGQSAASSPHVMEWCDVAHCFRVAPPLADRASRRSPPPARTGGGWPPALRAG